MSANANPRRSRLDRPCPRSASCRRIRTSRRPPRRFLPADRTRYVPLHSWDNESLDWKRDWQPDDIQFKINLPDESFHSYRCDAPALEIDVSKDELVDMYTKMVRPLFLSTRNSR